MARSVSSDVEPVPVRKLVVDDRERPGRAVQELGGVGDAARRARRRSRRARPRASRSRAGRARRRPRRAGRRAPSDGCAGGACSSRRRPSRPSSKLARVDQPRTRSTISGSHCAPRWPVQLRRRSAPACAAGGRAGATTSPRPSRRPRRCARRAGSRRRRAGRGSRAVPALVVVAHDRPRPASRSSGSSSLSPISGCVSMIRRSSSSSAAGFRSTRSGMPILPMSWRIAPRRIVSISSCGKLEQLGDADRERGEPLAVAVQVGVARLDRVRERARERRREQPLAQSSRLRGGALERVGDRRLQLGVGKRLGDEAGRATRQRLAQRVVGAGARDEHHGQRGAARAHGLEQLEAGEARHDHVADDEVELVVARAAPAHARRSRRR